MVEGAELIKWEGAEWVEFRLQEEELACRTHDKVNVHLQYFVFSAPSTLHPTLQACSQSPAEKKRKKLLTCIRHKSSGFSTNIPSARTRRFPVSLEMWEDREDELGARTATGLEGESKDGWKTRRSRRSRRRRKGESFSEVSR